MRWRFYASEVANLWSFQHSAYAALSLLRRDYLNNRYPRFIMPFGLKVEPHLFLLAYIYVKFGAIPLLQTAALVPKPQLLVNYTPAVLASGSHNSDSWDRSPAFSPATGNASVPHNRKISMLSEPVFCSSGVCVWFIRPSRNCNGILLR